MWEIRHEPRFERRLRRPPRGAIIIVLALALFTLLWVLVPYSVLYWLLLPLIALLVWVASYGWRQAVAVLHNLIHKLEQD